MELRQCDFFCLKRFYHNAPAGKQTQKDQPGEKPASVQKDHTFKEFYDLMFLLIVSLVKNIHVHVIPLNDTIYLMILIPVLYTWYTIQQIQLLKMPGVDCSCIGCPYELICMT